MSFFNKKYFSLVLKGMGMGAADVVPGVSGGTIAFITGIYEDLINSIKSINIASLKLLFQFKFKQFSDAINFKFLLSVFSGVLISVLSVAQLLKYLLLNFPIHVWSFFFGLILASTIIVSKNIDIKKISNIIAIVIGVFIAVIITSISPTTSPDANWFVFLSGAIAICAMILPGISGAFILLILGKYQFIISALSEFKIITILTFVAGAAIGLISFSNVLHFLLKKYHNITIGVLTGFMLGSLNKVWPWKETIKTYIDRHGNMKPLLESNILPNRYNEINNEPSYIFWAISLCLIGFFFILFIEKTTNKDA
ncbi:MAG: DUF368 domain-containing protein [Marinifilaceae bacterium]|jgi:putative membrane protein|nr:DUF368 domain-containing protein [Marinifilaceae bacterium]